LQTSSSPPPPNQYNSYQPPQSSARPQSTYGSGPQELSTSAYDSPIAPQNANPAAPYSYPNPDEDPYTAAAAANSNPLGAPSVPPPSVPAPSAPSPELGQPSYGQNHGHGGPPPGGQYAPYAPQSQPPQMNPYGGGGYDAPSPNDAHPQSRPPVPTMSPPPLQPGGPAYDARQTLPSRATTGGQPQYNAYVPPGSSAPSAPMGDDSGPGPGSGPSAPPAGGPTAPAAEGYYRAAAY
jgi:signal transducing adaptor molecule